MKRTTYIINKGFLSYDGYKILHIYATEFYYFIPNSTLTIIHDKNEIIFTEIKICCIFILFFLHKIVCLPAKNQFILYPICMHRTQQTQNRPFGFSFQNGSSFFPHSLHALKDPYSPSPSNTARRFPPLPPHSINHTSSQIRYSLSQCIARQTEWCRTGALSAGRRVLWRVGDPRTSSRLYSPLPWTTRNW
jgi:hypothetical protein